MALRFSEYKSARESAEFSAKFNALCEAIAISGIKFETYWTEHFLPTINESAHVADADELLNEFWGNLFGGGPKKPEGPAPDFSSVGQPSASQQMMDRLGQWQNDPKALGSKASVDAAKEAARQKKLADFQSRLDKEIENVKQRFSTAMKDFLKAMTNDAKMKNDPHMWKIAQGFYNKIMSAAQPVADSFKVNAKFGKASYVDNFGRVRDPHMQGVQDFYGNMANGANPAASPTPEAGSTPADTSTIQGGNQPPATPNETPLFRKRGERGRFLPRS